MNAYPPRCVCVLGCGGVGQGVLNVNTIVVSTCVMAVKLSIAYNPTHAVPPNTPPPTQSYAPNNTACSILQPGSTVATALSEGESKPKHAFLLKILGVSWKLDIFPLETVRPFIFDSVELAKNTGLDPQAPGAVERYLHSRIEAMLGKASKMQRGAEGHGATQQHGWQGDADGGGGRRGGGGGRKRKQRDGVPEGDEGVKDMLPLIRLRVDYSGTGVYAVGVCVHTHTHTKHIHRMQHH